MKQLLRKLKGKATQHKLLIHNFSYLSGLQIFTLLIPLLSYPYLIRVLGKETYGLIVFAQAIVGYFVILVGFGFNISATKEISIHRDNNKKLSEIVSSVLIIKGGLFILSLLILTIVLWLLPQSRGYEVLFYLTMWMCLYDIIFPIWYFQGIEQMKYITYFTLVSRLFFFAMIFILIKSSDDYLLMPIINGIGALIAGILSLFIIFSKHGISFKLQPSETIKKYLIDSLPIFLSNVSIRFFVSTNKVIIGSFLGMAEVSYYDLGEKIISVLKIPQSLFSQTIFPKISIDKNISFVKKAFKISVVINFLLFIGVIIFSKYIVLLLGGEEMKPAIWVINILALSVPIIAMSNIFGVQLLIPFGKLKLFSQIIISSGIIYLIQLLLIWLVWNINIYSVSIITVTTEIVVTSTMFYFCKKNKLW